MLSIFKQEELPAQDIVLQELTGEQLTLVAGGCDCNPPPKCEPKHHHHHHHHHHKRHHPCKEIIIIKKEDCGC